MIHKSMVLSSMDIARSVTNHILTKSCNESQTRLILHMVNDAINANSERVQSQVSLCKAKQPNFTETIINTNGGGGNGGRN